MTHEYSQISDQRVFAVVIVVHGYMQSFCNTADPAPPLTNDQQVVRLRTVFRPAGAMRMASVTRTVLKITLKRLLLRLWAAMGSLVKADRPTTLRKAVIGTPCGCARGCLRLRISMPREAHAGLESCSEHLSR